MSRKPYYAEGNYVGVVVKHALTSSQNKGTPQFLVVVHVKSDEGGDEFPRAQQYERSIYLPLTEATLEPGKGWVLEVLDFLGFEGESLAELDPSHPRAFEIDGKEFPLWCKHEEYNGDTREKWNFSRNREVIAVAVDPKKLKKLDSLFGKAKRAGGASAKSATTKKSSGAGPDRTLEDGTTITDADIPANNEAGPQEGYKFDPDEPFISSVDVSMERRLYRIKEL